ncbi:energy transducer TonB [Winogradskyella sp. A3E31]|uniref:energy transducer TonB family protein n=1 Tax=Winogradskyella sp. A3E31 TaxID=3349637 RepID=UPI00398B9441
MTLLEKHKALIITFLVTGIVVFGLFSIHLTKKSEFIAESVYEIEPKTEEEILEELEALANANLPSTNKAFNEDQDFKEMMKNFKTVTEDAGEESRDADEAANESDVEEELTTNSSYTSGKAYALKQSETESYNKLKDVLKKKSDNLNKAGEHSNTKSTLTYSLKGRALVNYKTPRYLCEDGGRVVVTIHVNRKGRVTDASINGASQTNNQCLTDHAIEYAKNVLFNQGTKSSQIGTITFAFKGKN